MLGKIYGYIRVSTKEQNEDRQRIAMEAYGVPWRRQRGRIYGRDRRRASRLRGVRLGRRPLAIPEEFQEVRSLWEDGMYSATMAASILGVDRHTFMKWVRDEKIV